MINAGKALRFALFGLLLLVATAPAHADCAYGAKSKTKKLAIVDNHTISLTGGFGPDVLIKTTCTIYSTSKIVLLKDSFCTYSGAVLKIDGVTCSVREVTRIN